MKKIERIQANIRANKDLIKRIENERYYSIEALILDAKEYISDVKSGAMYCVIKSVSSSGMSRTMNFGSNRKGLGGRYRNRQYNYFLRMMGETYTKDGYIRVNGCGMDMVFATNYNIIRELHRLGFVGIRERDELAQMTPIVL